jgi:hypothetical protein
VGMILLAGVPFLALLAAWNGLGLLHLATMALLLAAVGLGGGGLAVAASIVSRRGRDALLTVYILMMLLTLSPMLSWLGLPAEVGELLFSFNPYFSMNRLVMAGEVAPALWTSAFWLLLGLAGSAVAVWRLRPSTLAPTGGVAKKSRRGRVPPLDERPMLWKELYIERVGTLGRFGRWLGVFLTVSVGGGSLVLAAIILGSWLARSETDASRWAADLFSVLLAGSSGMFLGWMLQWGVGLRAAVSIASERERGTWDALLMSDLKPGEIGRAKLYGSVYALRWMAGALLLAWTLGVALEVVPLGACVKWVAGNAVACAAMAAIGVRCSLSLPTATKAMTWTIALWLAAHAVVAFLAMSIIAIVVMTCLAVWAFAVQHGFLAFNSAPWFPMSMGVGWPLTVDLVTPLITIMIVADTALRFDRIAGRMAGGAVATTVDTFLRGNTHRPVLLPGRNAAKVKKPSPVAVLPTVPPAGALHPVE